tara:strand:+ start:411 stop:542 length:132 start_codon:yes stop_codon:yes gene_type:complete
MYKKIGRTAYKSNRRDQVLKNLVDIKTLIIEIGEMYLSNTINI